MNKKKVTLTSIGMFLLLGLAAFFLTSCNHGDDDSSSTGAELVAPELRLGLLSPRTGTLGYFDREPIEATMLAVNAINAAGGRVQISTKDTATNVDTALNAFRQFEMDDIHAIVGAYSSLVSLGIVDEVIASGIVMISPASSSPVFTRLEEDNEHNLFFRTVANNELWAIVVAAEIQANGGDNVAIVYRNDGFGTSIAENTMKNLRAAGVNVGLDRMYDPNSPDTEAIADEVVAANVDSVFLVSFAEGANVISSILEQTTSLDFYLAALSSDGLGETVDPLNPGAIAGFIDINPATHPDAVTELISDVEFNHPYSGSTYDAVIVLALAAFAAQSNDPLVFSKEISDVTRGGTKCMSYAHCETLLRAGENIDYDGAAGPLEFSDAGEPVISAYRIFAYNAAGEPTAGRIVISPNDFSN